MSPLQRQPNREKSCRLDLSISCNFQQLWVWLAEKPPPRDGKRLGERPSSHHTWIIPMVHILQIHTQIPPIQISSIGYQLCQLFKILTYIELQNTRSWCRWKAYRQPCHSTHYYPCYHCNITWYGTLKCHYNINFICLYLINQVTDKTFSYAFGTKLVPKV